MCRPRLIRHVEDIASARIFTEMASLFFLQELPTELPPVWVSPGSFLVIAPISCRPSRLDAAVSSDDDRDKRPLAKEMDHDRHADTVRRAARSGDFPSGRLPPRNFSLFRFSLEARGLLSFSGRRERSIAQGCRLRYYGVCWVYRNLEYWYRIVWAFRRCAVYSRGKCYGSAKCIRKI